MLIRVSDCIIEKRFGLSNPFQKHVYMFVIFISIYDWNEVTKRFGHSGLHTFTIYVCCCIDLVHNRHPIDTCIAVYVECLGKQYRGTSNPRPWLKGAVSHRFSQGLLTLMCNNLKLKADINFFFFLLRRQTSKVHNWLQKFTIQHPVALL